MTTTEASHEQPYTHFVTFSCYKRRRLLDNDPVRRIVLGVLNSQMTKQDGRLVGFVLMPDHVHALVWLPRDESLPQFMKQWKQRSSRNIRKLALPLLPSYGALMKADDPFWQRKYYAFQIYSRQKLEEKLNYIHQNPVRAGLADRAAEWRWSSARHYEDGRTVGVPITWVY
ncbi:MAG: REP-associated tyrosine transposase [Planctomycetales bacterium]|jgi:putative transposase